MSRLRWLAGADRYTGTVAPKVCVGACLEPLIEDGSCILVDAETDVREWDLVAIAERDDRVIAKQVAILDGETVMLSTLPPVRLKDRRIIGKVVAVADPPRGIERFILRWFLRKRIAAAERESREFTELCLAKMRELYRTEHPAFPTWEPQRLQWA